MTRNARTQILSQPKVAEWTITVTESRSHYAPRSAGTHAIRDAAGKATAERQRRRHVQPDQAKGEQQAQAQDEAELELSRRSLSALPDEPVDQFVHQGYRLCLTDREVNS